MNTLEQVKRLGIDEILQKLGIKTSKQGTTLALHQDGNRTGGWKADTKTNIVSDFSEKGRASGDQLDFLCTYLNINKHEGMKWFEDNFNIINDFSPTKQKISMNYKWESLETLGSKQIDYLTSRGIDYSLLTGVLKNNGKPTIPIMTDLDGTMGAFQSRDINGNGRYYIDKPKGGSADGIFYDELDYSKDNIILVEGWSDFLTIRQFTTQVVGLVNASNEHQMNLIKQLSMTFRIYFSPDKDEAGEKALEKLKDRGIEYYLFDVGAYGAKDINEAVSTYGLGKDILNDIKKNSIAPETNITRALSRAKQNIKKDRILIGDNVIDKQCLGFRRGTGILVNGQSTGGKTTFSLYLLINLLKNTKYIINYYSLETDIGEQFIAVMAFYSGKIEKQLYGEIDDMDLSALEGRLFLYDDIRDYAGLTAHVTQTKPDVFFVDYVQKLKIEGIYDETQKMVYYAQEMQNFLIDNGHSVGISLSQVAMSNYNAPLIQRTPKNSGALLEASDVVINVGKEDGLFLIGFFKCKGGVGWGKVFQTHYQHEPRKYGIFADEFEESKLEKVANFKKLG